MNLNGTLRILLAGTCLLSATLPAQTSAAGAAMTPPMGWNSWNWFAEKVTDKDVRQAADLIVSSGMRDAGYVYVNIDDTWQGKRDSKGVLHPNEKFPDMKALADYVHGKGLKIGIYSSPGPTTCARYEGSYGHEQQDADQYAAWGIDYLKYDLCSFAETMRREAPDDKPKQFAMMKSAYELMHKALQKTGRPIVYSLCQYGWDAVWEWGPSVGANLWRTTDDINANFTRMAYLGRGQAGLERYAGPGHWNDPDMLEVGNGKLTPDENRLHMSLWAMLAAPLLAGNNLGQMTPDTVSVLTNKEIVAIDQDAAGRQAERIFAEGPLEVWSKPLASGETALAVFNFGDSTYTPRTLAERLPKKALALKGGHEIWTGRTLQSAADLFQQPIPEHAVRIARLAR